MKNKKLLLASAFVATTGICIGQNPIIKDQFTADPTARVFEGKMYLYPSHDIPAPGDYPRKDWFCMADYHVFSSENLVDWTDHGVIVDQKTVPWVVSNSYSMWAPDCVFKNGKYYFYFPSTPQGEGKRGFAIGVAVSDKPYGPFIPQAEPIAGVNGIDPCVLIDTDGQAYIYWSGRGMSVAKLKDNMLELASEPIQIQGLPEGFKEGPFAFQRNGKYYYTFPWVRDKTETLAYAMGDSPMGPFEFKGIIMDELPTGCWTNHHSLVEYEGQWYLFYHHNDYSPEFDKNRSARIDSLHFNPDGTIQKVIPTLRGVGVTDARKEIQLDRYSRLSDSGASIDYLHPANKFEGWKTLLTKEGAWVQYNRVDFGNDAVRKVIARASSGAGGTLQVRLKGANGPVIAEIKVPKSNKWAEIETSVRTIETGIHDLYVSLKGNNKVEVDWIRFK